jgi:hypothetical protein
MRTLSNRQSPPPKEKIVTRFPKRGARGGRLPVEDKVIATFPDGPEDRRGPKLPCLVGEGESGTEVPNGEGSSRDWDVQPSP